MPAPSHGYGDVCPVLNIARHYGVPYAMPLAMVDQYLHGRELPTDFAQGAELEDIDMARMTKDCVAVYRRMLALRYGTETVS